MIYGTWATKEVQINGVTLRPESSQAIMNHSPDGFNWGFGGSGPAQLALALLFHYAELDQTKRWYEKFKADVIAILPQSDFEIPESLVRDWIEAQTRREATKNA
mgnify:CR=1 FL=1